MTTTTRRLLAALVLAGSLAVPAGTAAATTSVVSPATAPTALPATVATSVPDPADGVRVSVEITERDVSTVPRVAVVGSGPLVVGGRLELRGTGLAPSTTYEVWLESDPVLLGTVTTDADGVFLFVATIPAGTTPGEHHVRLVPVGAVRTCCPSRSSCSPHRASRTSPGRRRRPGPGRGWLRRVGGGRRPGFLAAGPGDDGNGPGPRRGAGRGGGPHRGGAAPSGGQGRRGLTLRPVARPRLTRGPHPHPPAPAARPRAHPRGAAPPRPPAEGRRPEAYRRRARPRQPPRRPSPGRPRRASPAASRRTPPP